MPHKASSLTSPRLFTTFEVAAMFRVSKQTVYRLVRDGDLKAVRIGRTYRIPEHAVTSYLGSVSSQVSGSAASAEQVFQVAGPGSAEARGICGNNSRGVPQLVDYLLLSGAYVGFRS